MASRLSDHREWVALLRTSDAIGRELADLGMAKVHQVKAKELMAKFSQVCARIEEHLRTLNLQALPHHKQFAADFEDIRQELHDYLGQIKEEFDLQKKRVNDLLASFKIDARMRVTFNPMDVDGCYAALYEGAAAELTERVVASSLAELKDQRLELDYAASVLDAIPADEAQPLRAGIDAAAEAMRAYQGKITPEWVQSAIRDEDGSAAQADAMRASYEAALAAVRDARKVILQETKPKTPTDDRGKRVLEHLSQGGEADLKELILQAIAAGDGPSAALEQTLATLVELFKRNCVQVRLRGR